MHRKIMVGFCLVGFLVSSLAAEVKLSERLAIIAEKLGEGGVHFSVTDSENDLRDLSQTIDRFIASAPQSKLPHDLKFENVVGDLGLYSFLGSGSSAHQTEEGWHNRSFFLTDGEHEGLLSLLGKEAEVAAAMDFAPAGADIVLETSLDLRAAQKTVRKIARHFGPEAVADVDQAFGNEVPELGMSLAELFIDFTVRGTLVLWLDREKTFEMPEVGELPVPHFAARMENAQHLWAILPEEIRKDSVIEEEGSEVILTPKTGPTPTPFGEILPRLVYDKETKELFFSLTEEDLAVCRQPGKKLANDASFQKATQSFPEKTNSLAYFSSNSFRVIEKLLVIAESTAPQEGRDFVNLILPYFSKLGIEAGYAAAISVEKDGFLATANMPMPNKGGSLSGLSGISSFAVLSGLAAPTILKAQKDADLTEQLVLAKDISRMALEYEVELGERPKSLEVLRKKFPDEELWRDIDLLEITWVTLEGDFDEQAVQCYFTEPLNNRVAAALANGAARSIPVEQLAARLGE